MQSRPQRLKPRSRGDANWHDLKSCPSRLAKSPTAAPALSSPAGFSTTRIVSRSAPLQMTDRMRVPRPCLACFWRDRPGILTLSDQLGRSKSPPARTERGKDGAPGFVGDVEERPFMAALSVKKVRPLGPGRASDPQINMAWAPAHAMSVSNYCCWASTICGKGFPLLSFVSVSSV